MVKKKSEMRGAEVTMRDVAKLAGVSQSTVSRVLSQKQSLVPISEETARKVHEAIAALDYYPNLAARSLRGQSTKLIAIMIADISNPLYHTMVRTVQNIARQHGYDVLVANTDQVYENEQHFCEAMMRRPVDGIVMVPYHLTDDEIGNLMDRTGAYVVALASHLRHPEVDRVFSDDGNASYETVKWLIEEKRHRRIAFIGVPENYPPGMRRHRGYVRAMQEAGLPILPGYEQQGDFTVASGQEAMHALLQLSERPTAVFVCNDLMAIGANLAAGDRGVRVPDEVALVGFDNIPEGTYIRPQLTTIAQFPKEFGTQLANALFERIEGKVTGPGRSFQIPLQRIEREST